MFVTCDMTSYHISHLSITRITIKRKEKKMFLCFLNICVLKTKWIFLQKEFELSKQFSDQKKYYNVQAKWKKIQTKTYNFGWSHITLNHDFICAWGIGEIFPFSFRSLYSLNISQKTQPNIYKNIKNYFLCESLLRKLIFGCGKYLLTLWTCHTIINSFWSTTPPEK